MTVINTVIKGGGTTPTGTKNITANGIYNVTDYASADVQVPTTAPTEPYFEYTISNGTLTSTTNRIASFSGITKINISLAKAYYNNTNISGSVDMSDVQILEPIIPLQSGLNCYYMFYGCTGITSVDLGSLTTISGSFACGHMFDGCTSLTSVDLGSLTTVSASSACVYMFNGCIGLTSVDLGSLTTVSASSACEHIFDGCTSLTSVDLGSLTTVSAQSGCEFMFNNCTSLTSVDLGSLTKVTGNYACRNFFVGCTYLSNVIFSSLTKLSTGAALGNSFQNCTSLTMLSFPSLTPSSFGTTTSQFNNMLQGVTGCTVHFPSNIQSAIGSWSSVTNGFGGTNTTVLFDLPATVTLTGADTVTYTRNPKYDTATALAWKVGAYGTTNFTPAYYTSGTTDPAVSDTIYSDAACTTSVTTIDSIA